MPIFFKILGVCKARTVSGFSECADIQSQSVVQHVAVTYGACLSNASVAIHDVQDCRQSRAGLELAGRMDPHTHSVVLLLQ